MPTLLHLTPKLQAKPSNARDKLKIATGVAGVIVFAAILPGHPLLGVAGVAASAGLIINSIRSLRADKVNVCDHPAQARSRNVFKALFTAKDLTPQNFNPNSAVQLKALALKDHAQPGSINAFLDRLPLAKLDKLEARRFSPQTMLHILDRQEKLIKPDNINVRNKKTVKSMVQFAKKAPGNASRFFSQMTDQARRDLFNATTSKTLRTQLIAARYAARATGSAAQRPGN